MKSMDYMSWSRFGCFCLSIFSATGVQAYTVEAVLKDQAYSSESAATQSATAQTFSLADVAKHPWDSNDQASSLAISAGNGNFATSVNIDKTVFNENDSSSSFVTFKDSFTNSSATAQQINFDLRINALGFKTDIGNYLGANSTFSANVYVNNSAVPIWSASYTLGLQKPSFSYDSTYNPMTFTSTGQSLGSFSGGLVGTGHVGYYSYTSFEYALSTPYSQTLSLGQLNPNETVSIRYEVQLDARNGDSYGRSQITFDDPAGLSAAIASGATGSLGLGNSLHIAAAVPEPETYAMLVAGLGLVGGAARRQKRKQEQVTAQN